MLSVTITQTGAPLESWINHLKRIDSVFRTDRPLLRQMADILEFEHKDAFERGYRDPAEPWTPTFPYFAERERGWERTLVWSGTGAESIQSRVKGDTVEVRAESYLAKFQFGNQQTSIPMIHDGTGDEGWDALVALPGETPDFYHKTKVFKRKIFDVLPRDAEQAMFNLGEQIGNMEYSGGTTSVFR